MQSRESCAVKTVRLWSDSSSDLGYRGPRPSSGYLPISRRGAPRVAIASPGGDKSAPKRMVHSGSAWGPFLCRGSQAGRKLAYASPAAPAFLPGLTAGVP
jgi:hypothetical protein